MTSSAIIESTPFAAPAKKNGSAATDQEQQLAALHAKLDRLAGQVEVVYQRSQAVAELKEELMPVAQEALVGVQGELQQLEGQLDLDAWRLLLRKVAASAPRLVRLLDKLEALDDLAGELAPLGGGMLGELAIRLDDLEQRGVLRLLRGGADLLDRIAAHYSQADIDQLSDNIVQILDTVKNLTQPDLLNLANNAASVIHEQEQHPPPRVSLWGMLRAMGEPEVQQGVGALLEILRGVARTQQAGRAVPQSTHREKPLAVTGGSHE